MAKVIHWLYESPENPTGCGVRNGNIAFNIEEVTCKGCLQKHQEWVQQ